VKRALSTIAVAVAAAAIAVAATAGKPPASGVRGVLRLSHGCPGPARADEKRRCDFAGANVVIRAYGSATYALAGADRTDAAGRFEIALPPGRYLVQPDLPAAKSKPEVVSVRRGAWATITLRYLIPPYML
jgi:hypothetical protein